MQADPTPKVDLINFIKYNLVPEPDNLNDLTTLRQIKKMLEEIKKKREQTLIEEGIDNDDWIDDELLGQAEEYINELNEKRLADEEQNIDFTRNVSLALQKGRKTSDSKLPYITIPIQDKIKSYGINPPKNPKPEFERISRFGGKVKKSRKSIKSRKSRKSRKNKRKTRKYRK
jgi:hypothetical protein